MKIKLHHIAIVYDNYEDPLKLFKELTKGDVEEFILEERGLKWAFLNLQDAALEFLSPIREKTAITNFLKKRGPGIHHICLSVDEFDAFLEEIKGMGIPIIDGPRPGAHGQRVAFLDPRATHKILIEIIEESSTPQN